MYTHWLVYFEAMPRNAEQTRTRIVEAATRLFYREGIRSVSVDAVAERSGVTKRTLYYHFKSKDDLVAAYLSSRDQPSLALFSAWFEQSDGTIADKVQMLFERVGETARHPKWRGCGFLRTIAELVDTPGHPAVKIGAAHKRKFENWLAETYQAADLKNAETLARQTVLLMDGAFSTALVHRDATYFDTAGRAAAALIRAHDLPPSMA